MNRTSSEEDLRVNINQVVIFPRSDGRAVGKSGERNIKLTNIPEKFVRYIGDFVTTLVEERWHTTLSVFVATYFCSWTIFAMLYYIIALAHGDLSFDENGNRLGKGDEPCINEATSFFGFMLMSVETQVSTGYGTKYATEECLQATILVIIQLTVGVVIDGSMIGILYSKIIKPPKYKNIKFSKKAVICTRDGVLCLLFRVCDFKQTQSINTKVRAFLFETNSSEEGESDGKVQQRLTLENNGRILLYIPTTICHFINSKSPLYNMTPMQLADSNFEIVLSMTGISEKTGLTSQSRTSYLPHEILWGHTFRNVINFDKGERKLYANTKVLDDTEPIETPLCSARELADLENSKNEGESSLYPKSFYLGGNRNGESDDEENKDGNDSKIEELPMDRIYP